jgi:hypothetical protein
MDSLAWLAQGGPAPGAGAERGPPPEAPGGQPWTSFLHVWTDEAGVVRAVDVPLAGRIKGAPIDRVFFRAETRPLLDLRGESGSLFVATLQGDLEVEVAEGKRVGLPPSRLTYFEDAGAKGRIVHVRQALNLYMHVTPGFDVRRWAGGQA